MQFNDKAHRTELGKRLRQLREDAVNSGLVLFSEDEILEEIKRRRGEDALHVQAGFHRSHND